MARIKKAKVFNVFSKVRSALRKVWMFSPARRDALKAAKTDNGTYFCSLCQKLYDKWAMDVDHIEPAGAFATWAEFGVWADRLFTNPLQAICKNCHLIKSKEQRKKK